MVGPIIKCMRVCIRVHTCMERHVASGTKPSAFDMKLQQGLGHKELEYIAHHHDRDRDDGGQRGSTIMPCMRLSPG